MLNVENLSFSYGRKNIFESLSFHVNPGDCVGLVGCNGCGKSTLLSVLAGCRATKSGNILLAGKDTAKDPKLFSRLVGYVPQEIPFIPELSVYDNLLFWFHGNKKELNDKLSNPFYQSLDIDALIQKRFQTISGGQRKKVGIASALLNQPPLLLLDEPGSALDLGVRNEITAFLQSYLQNGGTILITTHEECELNLCNRLIAMRSGSIHEIPNTLRGLQLLQEIQ